MDSTSLNNMLTVNNNNIFGAVSENGTIIGKSKKNTWVCSVPYSTVSLLLSK